MATFNLVITYPDAAQTRVLNALKAAAATNGNPSPTNAQAIEWLRQQTAWLVKTIVKDHEIRDAAGAVREVGTT